MLAKAFPLNISIDATHKTCVIANLCLLTITAKDSLGYTNVLLRMWIPNQKTWMFRFVLEYVIPTMIGSSYCKLVQAIISDGDPQLIKCIEGAIVKIYNNAIRIPCTWHLVERSMNGASTNFVAKKHVSKYWKEWFLQFFQTWLYSFMRPNGGINSEEEYNVSKCILLGVINSDAMKEYFTKDGIQHLNTFLTEKIFVYEGVYASYLRNKLFNWEVHSNSAHEGTNSAIKHNSNPVSPNDSLGFATYKMAKYDELLMHERERQIQNEYMKTKLFSVQWKNLTTNAIGIVENQKQRSERCHVRWHKVDECFYCIETVSDDIEEGKFKSSMSSATSSSSSLSSSRTDEDNNILPNTKSKNITKKELQNLSGEELTRRMTSSEREMVECIKGKSKGSSKYDKLKIPKFKRSWKLKLKQAQDGSFFISCDCNKDSRFGGICMHKFAAYNSYLKKIGILEWTSNDVHFMHWSSYAYLMQVQNDSLLNSNEKEMLRWMKNKLDDPQLFSHYGTMLRFHKEITTNTTRPETLSEIYQNINMINMDMVTVQPQVSDLCLSELYDKRAKERVMYYDEDEVQKFLDLYGTSYDSSRYEVELSQRFSSSMSFHDDLDEEEEEEEQNGDNKKCRMEARLHGGLEEPGPKTVPQKKASILKQIYEIIGVTDLNSEQQYSFLTEELQELHKKMLNVRTSGNVMTEHDSLTYFPGTTHGNRGKDAITSGNKRIRR